MSRNVFHVSPQYQPLMRVVGLDAETIFSHPQIVVWRKLADRENCTLDAEFDGRRVRLHVKRYTSTAPAQDEVKGIELLQSAGIPTVPLVGWGTTAGGRSFVMTEDLQGYAAADKALAAGLPFASILEPTADLAAKLHRAGLHHRDLYLCHFFVRAEQPEDVRLIDPARVAKLSGLFRNRWIVKDLAQFWYSTLALPITDEQREQWLARYRGERMKPAILRKVQSIARHDQKLRRAEPTRNISMPHQ